MRWYNWWKLACFAFLLCTNLSANLRAETFTTLHSFDSTDGAGPYAALVQGMDGNLYGTTEQGGTDGGYGTVFKITPSGALTTLYDFCSKSDCTDGWDPAGLVQATDGNLYGTTVGGGANGPCTPDGGCGTVFRITPSGAMRTLYSFCSETNCWGNGSFPAGALIQAIDGNLYGTTVQGGAYGNYGTVFKISLSGTLTTLYSFCAIGNCTDGSAPFAGLVQGTDGNFYGTTSYGGANNYGTVFKITPSGTLTTLYSFCSQSDCRDGAYPAAALVQGTNGDFYGTTEEGGAISNYGTLFRITPSGALTTLYRFCSQGDCADGANPAAGLVQATDGNLYGTTPAGGASGSGTLFRITASGALTALYSFCSQSGCADGASSGAALIQNTDGSFYGTTFAGGSSGDGTVFSLSEGLGPFVETQPTSGPIGRPVEIFGTNLTGATSVTFNGTPATFTVKSKSVIRTAVPVGATTGSVQVVTPGGTLSSNVSFRVRP